MEINEGAHSKIMKDMIKYLDECKEKKENCECSGVLEYNKDEKEKLKKWQPVYQHDSNKNKNEIMKKITVDFIKGIDNYREEIYNVKK